MAVDGTWYLVMQTPIGERKATLTLAGTGALSGTLAAEGSMTRKVLIAANGEKRVDWLVKVTNEGQAVVRMKALTDEESDAMEMRFPCYVHGMLKMESFAGVLRPDDKGPASLVVRVPAERRINETRLEVRYSPTLAGALVHSILASLMATCHQQGQKFLDLARKLWHAGQPRAVRLLTRRPA